MSWLRPAFGDQNEFSFIPDLEEAESKEWYWGDCSFDLDVPKYSKNMVVQEAKDRGYTTWWVQEDGYNCPSIIFAKEQISYEEWRTPGKSFISIPGLFDYIQNWTDYLERVPGLRRAPNSRAPQERK